jgi:hypothetical protein
MRHLTGSRVRRPQALAASIIDLVDRVFADGGRRRRR